MINELTQFLGMRGFEKITTNLPEIIFLFKQESYSVNVLILIDYRPGLYLTSEQFLQLKENIRRMFEKRGVKEIHILSLLLCEDHEKAKALSGEDRFCWLIDPRQCRLMIYENRVSDFYGMKGMLEQFLEQINEETGMNRELRTGQFEGGEKSPVAIVTILLAAVNVILYLICTWGGNLLYNKGDLVGTAVFRQHEYYRIFTSMFLHGSAAHLISNMLVLYFLGEILEKELGRIRYTVLYFVSGIGAAFVSMAYQYKTADFVGSIGASGAIYGVLGALLYLIIMHGGRYRDATLSRMVFFLLYSFYSGFQATNVDNAAHLGGLICGFIIMLFLRKRSRVHED